MITGLMVSTMTLCFTQFEEKKLTVKDLKAELKSLPIQEEKKAAKQITVKADGIVYKDEFIPKTNSSAFKIITVRLTVY